MENQQWGASKRRTRRYPKSRIRKTLLATRRRIRARKEFPKEAVLLQSQIVRLEIRINLKEFHEEHYTKSNVPVKTKAAILLLSHGGAHSASIAYIAGNVTPLMDVETVNYSLDLRIYSACGGHHVCFPVWRTSSAFL